MERPQLRDMSRRARRVDPNKPLAVVEPRRERTPTPPGPRPEGLDRGGAHVWIGIPVNPISSPFPRSGYGPRSVAPRSALPGPIAEKRDESPRGGRRELLELGRDPRAKTVAVSSAPIRMSIAQSSPMSPSVSIAAVGDPRVGVLEHAANETGNRGMMRALEPVERGHAAPATPVRPGRSSDTPNESLGRPRAQRAAVPSPRRRSYRIRPRTTTSEEHPGRPRARARRVQRGEPARPPFLVVVPESKASLERGIRQGALVATIAGDERSTFIRLCRRRAEGAEGGVTVLKHGAPTGAGSARRAGGGAGRRRESRRGREARDADERT